MGRIKTTIKALGVIRELFFCAAAARPGGLRWAAAAVTVENGKKIVEFCHFLIDVCGQTSKTPLKTPHFRTKYLSNDFILPRYKNAVAGRVDPFTAIDDGFMFGAVQKRLKKCLSPRSWPLSPQRAERAAAPAGADIQISRAGVHHLTRGL